MVTGVRLGCAFHYGVPGGFSGPIAQVSADDICRGEVLRIMAV